MLNFGQARALSKPFEERFQPGTIAVGDAFDAAVGPVGDPAAKTELIGAPAHEVAKADALDVAVNERMEPLGHGLEATP